MKAVRTDRRMFDWRSIPLDRIYTVASEATLAVVIVISATRLRILPSDGETSLGDGGGNAVRQLLYLAAIVLMLVASRPFSRRAHLLRLPFSLSILIGWCAFSLTWSATPAIGTRRLILVAIMIWLAFRSVELCGYRRAFAVAAATGVGLMAANYAAVMLTSAAVHHGMTTLDDPSIFGSWRGILPHKNDAGPACAYTIMLLWFGAGSWSRFTRVLLIVAAFVFLMQTRSKTSMGLLAVALASGSAMLLYDARLRGIIPPIASVAAVAVGIAGWQWLPGFIQGLASSRDAFTGRIQIWRVMASFLQENPIWGAGFGSFWAAGAEGPLGRYTNNDWILNLVAEGHNGYLDLWTQIGLPGLVLAIAVLLVLPLAGLLMSRGLSRPNAALCWAIIIFAAGHNLTESSLLAGDQLGNFMLMLAIAGITAMRREARPAGGTSPAASAHPAWPGTIADSGHDARRRLNYSRRSSVFRGPRR